MKVECASAAAESTYTEAGGGVATAANNTVVPTMQQQTMQGTSLKPITILARWEASLGAA